MTPGSKPACSEVEKGKATARRVIVNGYRPENVSKRPQLQTRRQATANVLRAPCGLAR